MAHQPLIFPLFARAGLLPELSREGSFSSGICFRTSAKNGSKFIAGKQFKEGDKAQLLLPQGKFQEILMRKIEEDGTSEVRLGSRIVGLEQRDGSVDVHVQDSTGKEGKIEATYLIGADGSKSTVRKALGLSFNGETLPNQLVATDIKYDFHAHGFYDANFVIDPENYGLIGRITTDGLWRVSYGVPNEVPEEEVRRGAEEKIRTMLPDGGESGFELKRIAPYKAQQLCVESLWTGRVGLCGDAAHREFHPYIYLEYKQILISGSDQPLCRPWPRLRHRRRVLPRRSSHSRPHKAGLRPRRTPLFVVGRAAAEVLYRGRQAVAHGVCEGET